MIDHLEIKDKEVGQLKKISDIIPQMQSMNDNSSNSEDQIQLIKSTRTVSPLKTGKTISL